MAHGLLQSLGWDLTFTILSFLAALANLFISIFLFISHDDLDQGMIEPIELSDNLKLVKTNSLSCSFCLLNTSYR